MVQEKDINLFLMLLRSNTTSLLNTCTNYLKKSYGNNKVYDTEDFVYATGNIPILLLAHLDTVWYKKPVVYGNKDKSILTSKEGLGADDRAGVFAILKLISKTADKPSVLFTTGEESGGLGAMAFIKEFQEPPVPTKYIVEIDRRGCGQSVYYNCGNAAFESYINSYGFETNEGIFSDISFICPYWNVAGVNLSAGYYNEHTEKEIFKFEDLFYTIKRVQQMLEHHEKASFYKFDPKDQGRNLYLRCQVCDEIYPEVSFITVGPYKTLCCPKCCEKYVDWCEKCSKPYFVQEGCECGNGIQ